MAQPFADVRVIDFTQVIAGPFCTQHLAMLGADVIKLEQRDGGDQGRRLLADNDLGAVGMSPMFLSINAGKRSMTLDLKHPRAGEVVRRLVSGANAVVENFKAGTMPRMGFGYDDLRKVKPDLVYCSISGYGQSGPYAGAPAYDGAIQAASGMMSVTGHPDKGPTRAGFTAVDLSTGITAAFACAAALYRQKAVGEGQYLDVTMFEASLSMLAPLLVDYLTTGNMASPAGNSSPARIPTADSFAAKGGSILMTCLTEPQWRGLCDAMERPDLADDPALRRPPRAPTERGRPPRRDRGRLCGGHSGGLGAAARRSRRAVRADQRSRRGTCPPGAGRAPVHHRTARTSRDRA